MNSERSAVSTEGTNEISDRGVAAHLSHPPWRARGVAAVPGARREGTICVDYAARGRGDAGAVLPRRAPQRSRAAFPNTRGGNMTAQDCELGTAPLVCRG